MNESRDQSLRPPPCLSSQILPLSSSADPSSIALLRREEERVGPSPVAALRRMEVRSRHPSINHHLHLSRRLLPLSSSVEERAGPSSVAALRRMEVRSRQPSISHQLPNHQPTTTRRRPG